MSEEEKDNVVDLSKVRFEKSNAGKVIKACDRLDSDIKRMFFTDKIPPHEVLGAIAHRLGVFLGHTNADLEQAVNKLASIILRAAQDTRK